MLVLLIHHHQSRSGSEPHVALIAEEGSGEPSSLLLPFLHLFESLLSVHGSDEAAVLHRPRAQTQLFPNLRQLLVRELQNYL